MSFYTKTITPATKLVNHLSGIVGYTSTAFPAAQDLIALIWKVYQQEEGKPDRYDEALIKALEDIEPMIAEDDNEGLRLWQATVDAVTKALDEVLVSSVSPA